MRAMAAAAAIFVAGMVGTAPAQSEDSPAQQRRIFQDYGWVTEPLEEDGSLWLSLWEPHIRYRIDRQPEAKLRPLLFLIGQANDGHRAVTIRYDGTKGRLNSKTGTLDYPLCAILFDDLIFEPTHRCSDQPAKAMPGPEAALLLARAYVNVEDYRRAQQLLARNDFPDDLPFGKLLLRTRALAALGVAALEARRSPEADRFTAAALADYRALGEIEPDDVEHQFAIGNVLEELGGYAEARAVYERILTKWPEEDFRVAVRFGALHRINGEYEQALDALNQLVARNGPQEGMKFHYHRGWTLSLLGRFDEAIRDLSEGLKTQPDYAWAYLRRACTYAGIARLAEALADAQEANRIIAGMPAGPTSQLLREDVARAEALRARLEAALAAGDAKPATDACRGPEWESYEKPRPRSPLLPPA